ncbi:MAG: radical SAM family heme chaperone HemW [Phycisphaerales bacterium]|nr:radical SAM family heme chaperone HemW [Phycisphaerales bacterium]
MGLYLHWPYCTTKCGYCDFYSVPQGDADLSRTARALCQELSLRLAGAGPQVRTVFFGGGTPTTMAAPLLAEVLAAIHEAVTSDAPVEFTVEANPATVDAAKAQVLRDCGVDRISLGAQSFHHAELAFLERLHDPAVIPVAVRVLRDGGIANINLDLIFGVPGQTLASWRESLLRALALGPQHLACYGLTYEPNTALTQRLRQGAITPCDDGFEAEQYALAIEVLAEAGFEHYEISNFALPGRRCAHNLIYWHNAPYLAVGPSASGFTGTERYKNIAQHGEYVRRVEAGEDPAADHEEVGRATVALETLMMGMRLVEGFDLAEFAGRTGYDLRILAAERLASMQTQGLAEIRGETLVLTRRGLLLADGIIAELAMALDERPGLALPVVRTSRPAKGQ